MVQEAGITLPLASTTRPANASRQKTQALLRDGCPLGNTPPCVWTGQRS